MKGRVSNLSSKISMRRRHYNLQTLCAVTQTNLIWALNYEKKGRRIGYHRSPASLLLRTLLYNCSSKANFLSESYFKPSTGGAALVGHRDFLLTIFALVLY